MRMPLALQKPFYISFMGFIAALLNFMVTEISGKLSKINVTLIISVSNNSSS